MTEELDAAATEAADIENACCRLDTDASEADDAEASDAADTCDATDAEDCDATLSELRNDCAEALAAAATELAEACSSDDIEATMLEAAAESIEVRVTVEAEAEEEVVGVLLLEDDTTGGCARRGKPQPPLRGTVGKVKSPADAGGSTSCEVQLQT